MPRPDVAALGIAYRRIPLLAIGRDVYNDSRLIISKLGQLYPPSAAHPSISSFSPEQRAITRLLDRWTTDTGIFFTSAALVPSTLPSLTDENFIKDREQCMGKSFRKEDIERARPGAIVVIANAFAFLEDLLGDGREWLLGTTGPSLADIEGVWPFHFLVALPGALPPDQISSTQFPKVFAWIDRFSAATSAASEKLGEPKEIKGPEAVSLITSSEFAEADPTVDPKDAIGLRKGQEVEVWPIDSGFNNKDTGTLIGLTASETVIETKAENGQTIRVHAPRHGFSIRAIGKDEKVVQ
ncbi:MAG: hypothetical protein M1818_005857 [Claussenomyces sp. TS43310]|nr:MAG: hypothetical protein M1818_005857 [Claussenomyces sp. TS43310]